MATWLALDTHVPGHARVGVLGVSGWLEEREVPGRANQVLAEIAILRERYQKDLAGVAVVAGPGSFSSIRTGVLYANLYARLQDLPLYCIVSEDWSDSIGLAGRLASGVFEPQTYIAPVYDQEPNITIPTPRP